jgi:uncharacterized membrane protein YbhN (UPF0104 family)
MNRTLVVGARLAGAAAILGCLVWRLGAGPFLDGLRDVDGWSVLAALLLGAFVTLCSAWRWALVARGLGVPLPLSRAVAASYRAQFLNTVLPGGVVGDVHRGYRHGKDSGDLPRALRAVAWERVAGQLVQVLIAAVVLTVLPSPFRGGAEIALPLAAAGVVVLVVALRSIARSGTGRTSRLLRIARDDVRRGVIARGVLPRVVFASALAVAGYVAMFLLASHTAGSAVSLGLLLPIALLALLAMAVPLNVGGWGPREGVVAWAFASIGAGAAQGLAVSTVYGVLVAAATLPGAVVLVVGRLARAPETSPTSHPANAPRPEPAAEPRRAPVVAGGAARA